MGRAIIASAALLLGCGARSGLVADERAAADGGMDATVRESDAAVRDAAAPPSDAASPPIDASDAAADALAPPPDAPMAECVTDSDCDDGLACTDDRCDAGSCARAGRDAVCDDGLFCNGAERCATDRGCVARPAPCIGIDDVECTDDTCSELDHRCGVLPDHDRCPVTGACDPIGGCLLRAIANDLGQLYLLELPSGTLTPGPDLSPGFTDVALRADGTLYGASNSTLYRIDYAAGTAARIGSVGGSALEFGPDGELYGAQGSLVYRLDVATGNATPLAMLERDGRRLSTSGDIVFVGGGMLLTATEAGIGGTDLLVEVDLATGTSRVVGDTGERCVHGLALHDGRLYGLTCGRRLIEIDPEDGTSIFVATLATRIFGATVR